MDWVGGFQSSTKRCNLKLSGPNVKTGPPTNHVPFIILLSSYVEEGPIAARVTLILESPIARPLVPLTKHQPKRTLGQDLTFHPYWWILVGHLINQRLRGNWEETLSGLDRWSLAEVT